MQVASNAQIQLQVKNANSLIFKPKHYKLIVSNNRFTSESKYVRLMSIWIITDELTIYSPDI